MIKQLMDAGNGSVKVPEVSVSFEDGYLGNGVTGLRGVLKSMSIQSESSFDDVLSVDFPNAPAIATGSRTVVSMEVVLTSLELGPERMEEVTEEVVRRLQRALEF